MRQQLQHLMPPVWDAEGVEVLDQFGRSDEPAAPAARRHDVVPTRVSAREPNATLGSPALAIGLAVVGAVLLVTAALLILLG